MSLKYGLIAVLAIALTGCSKVQYVSEIYELDEFREIAFYSAFDVKFHNSDIPRIKVSGASDVLEEIELEQSEGVVKIYNHLKQKWTRPGDSRVQLDVYIDTLNLITAHETCFLTSTDGIKSKELGLVVGSKLNIAELKLDVDKFYYWNNFPCSGTLDFTGRADEFVVWNVALMQVDSRNCESKTAYIENSAQVDCIVQVSERLEYNIKGSGNIVVYGNPTEIIAVGTEGSGSLILMD